MENSIPLGGKQAGSHSILVDRLIRSSFPLGRPV